MALFDCDETGEWRRNLKRLTEPNDCLLCDGIKRLILDRRKMWEEQLIDLRARPKRGHNIMPWLLSRKGNFDCSLPRSHSSAATQRNRTRCRTINTPEQHNRSFVIKIGEMITRWEQIAYAKPWLNFNLNICENWRLDASNEAIDDAVCILLQSHDVTRTTTRARHFL